LTKISRRCPAIRAARGSVGQERVQQDQIAPFADDLDIQTWRTHPVVLPFGNARARSPTGTRG
jgi:hypothetical protein